MCIIENCNSKVVGRGLCRRHYQKARVAGNLSLFKTKPQSNPPNIRFEKLFTKQDNGCWDWTGGLNGAGYGMFWLSGKSHRAHRVSYSLYRGEVKPDVLVCHTCDNRKCVNPDHLFLGDHADNNFDAAIKNRMAHSENHSQAKLTNEQVREILESDESQASLARKYGVCQPNISDIKLGKRWTKINL